MKLYIALAPRVGCPTREWLQVLKHATGSALYTPPHTSTDLREASYSLLSDNMITNPESDRSG